MFLFLLFVFFPKNFALEFPSELTFKATYRDFIPCDCLLFAQSDDLISFLNDAFPSGTSISQVADSVASNAENENGHCNLVFNSANKDLWVQLFQNHTFLGHPDFDSNKIDILQGISRSDGVCTDGREFPIGSCVDEDHEDGFKAAIMKTKLQKGLNGLPLPVYCIEDDEDARCGFKGTSSQQTQTQKKFFDVWYNDDLTFNKRIGQNLKLKLKESDEISATYTFEAKSSFDFSEEPDYDGPTNNHFGPLDRFKTAGNEREVVLEELDSLQKIIDAPAWPQMQSKSGIQSLTFWFTTEIHSTFKFNSSTSMEFTFAGDDDFFAFINGILVIDLYGTHGQQSASVDLNSYLSNGSRISDLLGLEDGGVYTLDIYHAERQMDGSNFIMTSTLIPACDVTQIGANAFSLITDDDASSFEVEERFASIGVDVNEAEDGFFLQREGVPFSAGSFFTRAKENVATGFVANFLVRVDGETEGFAFVVQSVAAEDFKISTGASLGFADLPKSFVVAFDLCADREESSECNLQRVSVHYADDSNDVNNFSEETRKTFDIIHRDLSRNEFFPVEIIFYGENPNFLEVYVNNSLYLRENSFDIQSILGETGAHVGLTASSSVFSADIEIKDFFLEIVVVEPSSTQLISTDFSKETIVADGEDTSSGHDISTADLCGTKLLSGTLDDLVNAVFFEVPNEETGLYFNDSTTPSLVNGTVIDNDDGTYTVALRTTAPGEFGLAIVFGSDCFVNISLEEDENNTEIASAEASDDSVCFFELINGGSAIVEATEVEIIKKDPELELEIEDEVSPVLIGVLFSGGSICCLFVVLVPILIKYQNEWKSKKLFIEHGNTFRREVNTTYNIGDQYKDVGKKLVESQRRILQLESQGIIESEDEIVSNLKRENRTMKASIKRMKAGDQSGVIHRVSKVPKRPLAQRGRLDF